MRIYLDSAPVIYVVEQTQPYASRVDQRLSDAGIQCVASDLTRLECRMKPMADGGLDLLSDFDQFFEGVARFSEIVVETVDVGPGAAEK